MNDAVVRLGPLEVALRTGSGMARPWPPGTLRTETATERDPDGIVCIVERSPDHGPPACDVVIEDVDTGCVACCTGDEVTVHLRPDTREIGFRRLLQPVLGELAARRGLLVTHGAAMVGRSNGLLVLGGTASGKSTVAASALAAGWPVLADDAVLVDPRPAAATMTGVPRAMAVPSELVPQLGDHRAWLSTPSNRDRRELSATLLDRRTVEVGGIVLVAHASTAHSTAERADPFDGLRSALSAFWAVDREGRTELALHTATRLASLPLFRLALGRDARARVASTGEVLRTIDARANGSGGDRAHAR